MWLPKLSEPEIYVASARLYILHVLILQREENRSTPGKPLEKQEIPTMRNSTYMKRKPQLSCLFQWWEEQRVTPCATVLPYLIVKYSKIYFGFAVYQDCNQHMVFIWSSSTGINYFISKMNRLIKCLEQVVERAWNLISEAVFIYIIGTL